MAAGRHLQGEKLRWGQWDVQTGLEGEGWQPKAWHKGCQLGWEGDGWVGYMVQTRAHVLSSPGGSGHPLHSESETTAVKNTNIYQAAICL